MKKVIALLLCATLLSSSLQSVGRAEEKPSELSEESVQVENVEEDTEEETEGEVEEEPEENPEEVELIDISKYSVVISEDKFEYTGKAICPTVKVKAEDGTILEEDYYTVSYTNNTLTGTAKIEVTGKDGYTGTITTTFKIVAFLKTASVKTTPSYGKITVSWGNFSNAEGYKVYRKVEGGEYKRIKTISSASTRKYVDENVTFNKTYYYKIRAYKTVDGKLKYSEYTTEQKQKATVAKSTIKTVSSSDYNKIKITWNVVNGASGYQVYRSSSENGTYKRIATVSGRRNVSYTDTSCKCGVKYYYKVCAYRTVDSEKYKGAFSEPVVKNTKPRTTRIKTPSQIKYTSITLKWTKSAGAQGYVIYRSTSKNSGYKKVATVEGRNTLSYKDTGLTKHTVYYYKIRSYKIVNGGTVYSSYSNVYSKPKSGWRYENGYKFYYNAKGNRVKDVRDIIGKQKSYYIKVNKQRNTVTIYAKDSKTGKYNVPVVAFICSVGYPTPSGDFEITQKYRWKWLVGPSWGQWACRYTKGKLFHSVYYLEKNNPNTLGVSAYNRLGHTESHGCVRLRACDAKWIYDNCKVGTKVKFYNSATSGPFGKPSVGKLPYWHTWDPTDPTMQYKCEKYGCH